MNLLSVRFLAGVVVAAACAAGPAAIVVGAPSPADDPLGCQASIYDPGDLLDDAAIESAISTTELRLGADVRVRAEQSLDSGLDSRLRQLRTTCDGWSSGTELADDMVVVMFSTGEREASVYYGADLGPRLEYRWENAVDDMIPGLRDADYTEAVEDALSTLRSGSSASGPSYSYSSSSSRSSGSSNGGQVLLVVLLVVVIGGSWIYKLATGQVDWDGGDDDSSGWSNRSYRRRSSSFGGFSRSRSRSSGSSRSRSSGGSRRSGGGSKKW